MILINPYQVKPSFINSHYGVFDSTNEYAIKTGFSVNGYTAFTVSVWWRSSSTGTDKYIMSMPEDSAAANGCDLYQGAGQALRGDIKTSTVLALDTGTDYSDGAWHNILLWYDGVNGRIYVDNVQKATAAKTGTVSLTANQTNINRFGTFGAYMGGDYDEVSVWNVGLDATGRTALYNTGSPGNLVSHPNFASCTAWWRWLSTDNMTGTTGSIADNIGTNHLTPFLTESGDLTAY